MEISLNDAMVVNLVDKALAIHAHANEVLEIDNSILDVVLAFVLASLYEARCKDKEGIERSCAQLIENIQRVLQLSADINRIDSDH